MIFVLENLLTHPGARSFSWLVGALLHKACRLSPSRQPSFSPQQPQPISFTRRQKTVNTRSYAHFRRSDRIDPFDADFSLL